MPTRVALAVVLFCLAGCASGLLRGAALQQLRALMQSRSWVIEMPLGRVGVADATSADEALRQAGLIRREDCTSDGRCRIVLTDLGRNEVVEDGFRLKWDEGPPSPRAAGNVLLRVAETDVHEVEWVRDAPEQGAGLKEAGYNYSLTLTPAGRALKAWIEPAIRRRMGRVFFRNVDGAWRIARGPLREPTAK